MVVSECSPEIKASFLLWWIISSWSGRNLNLTTFCRMCRFFFFREPPELFYQGLEGMPLQFVITYIHPQGSTPLYDLYGDVPLDRAWVWSSLSQKGYIILHKSVPNGVLSWTAGYIFLGIFWSYKESWFETLSSSPIPKYWSSTPPPPPTDIHPVSMSQWPMYQLQYFLTLYLS